MAKQYCFATPFCLYSMCGGVIRTASRSLRKQKKKAYIPYQSHGRNIRFLYVTLLFSLTVRHYGLYIHCQVSEHQY